MSASSVWLVTGASSGFGLEISLAALAAGHKVVGTVRSKGKSATAVQKLESAGARTVELDVAQGAATVKVVAEQIEGVYGRVDVCVNNAGYSLLGALEDFGEEEAHLQFNTNVFGPLFLTQAILPGMRARKCGTIVNVTSVAGIDGLPSCGLYAATKFGLEGMSESLGREVSKWGINVLIVEPGGFRTNFLSAFVKSAHGLHPDYRDGAVDEVLQKFEAWNGKQPGDPVKGSKVIVDVVDAGCVVGGEKVLRLPLGKDCVGRLDQKIKDLHHDMTASREVAESTGYL